VRKAVDMIAARGMPALPIEVGKITIEGAECKGAFECYADDEALLRIRHLQGSRAMFVLASPDAYNGKTETPKPDVVGDLAMPKTGPGAEHDAGALAAIGRGNGADLDVRTAAGGALKRN
jgi:2-methylaconitate cis-trans-isomerase PrpF